MCNIFIILLFTEDFLCIDLEALLINSLNAHHNFMKFSYQLCFTGEATSYRLAK